MLHDEKPQIDYPRSGGNGGSADMICCRMLLSKVGKKLKATLSIMITFTAELTYNRLG